MSIKMCGEGSQTTFLIPNSYWKEYNGLNLLCITQIKPYQLSLVHLKLAVKNTDSNACLAVFLSAI